MKKILVTGAGGYIGRHVVVKLLDMGAEVIATDILVDDIDDRAIKIKTDLFSRKDCIFEEMGSPDICLHMSWRDGFIHNSDMHMEYLSKHYEFIKNMVLGGLKQLAVMGTMHEIGYYEGVVDENTQCNPISMYGVAKDALRRSVFLMLKDSEVVLQWFRAFYIYGDDKKNNSIFAKLIRAEEDGQVKFPFNTGKNKYDFIHVEELAQQLAVGVMQKEVDGIINCCTGQPVSLAEKIEAFIREHNFRIRLEYGAFEDRPYDSPGIWGDNRIISSIMEKG